MEDNKREAFEINDDELDSVVGGTEEMMRIVKSDCAKCKAKTDFRVASGGRGYCLKCNTMKLL